MKSMLISSRYPLTMTARTHPFRPPQRGPEDCAPAGATATDARTAAMVAINARLTILRTRRPPEEKSGSCAVPYCTTGDHRCREGRGRQNDGDGDAGVRRGPFGVARAGRRG